MNSNQVCLCHVQMKLSDGSIAENTKASDKPVKLILGNESLSPALESHLKTMEVGHVKQFTLEPEDAFGPVNKAQIHYMDRAKFSQESKLEEGMIMLFTQPSGEEVPGMIREIVDDSVTVDFNHPLAGQTISFEIELLEVME